MYAAYGASGEERPWGRSAKKKKKGGRDANKSELGVEGEKKKKI
jgi:hypothetical protein